MLQSKRLYAVCLALWFCTEVNAKVTVLANRSVTSVTVVLDRAGRPAEELTIPSGDSQPVFFEGNMRVSFGYGFSQQEFELKPYAAYFFKRTGDGTSLELEEIGLGPVVPTSTIENPMTARLRTAKSAVVTVKLLVDANEPSQRKIWEPKLRRRIAAASEIMERHSGIRFEVVAVDTWKPTKKHNNFQQTLREFERLVKPGPAQLAIGFSSHFKAGRGQSHLGVTRWPLHTHVLLRERSRDLLETEKVELLVHELGHYLGASHSPEPQSVMRPMLTRGLHRGVGSRIQFDPVNALIIGIMGEEVRRLNVRKVQRISKPTAKQLKRIYQVLLQAMPRDTAAQMYLRIMDLSGGQKLVADRPRRKVVSPLVRETQQVLAGLLRVAEQQHALQQADPNEAATTGDELTNLYIRSAIQSALDLRSANSSRAMLLALGIFVDDTETLRKLPGTGKFVQQVETTAQRDRRLEVLGQPTMRERADLTKHFLVSSHLHVALGKQATEAAGLAKEMLDSQGGTGFSFMDMAANRAGIVFAERVLADKLSLAELAQQFHVDDFLPTLRGLEEGLTAQQLQDEFGTNGQPTVNEVLQQVEDRVLSLPVYDQ